MTHESDVKIGWLSCFPEAQQSDDSRVLSREDLVNSISSQGFNSRAVQIVDQLIESSYSECY